MFQNYPSKTPRVCLSFGIEKAILTLLQEEVTNEQFEQIILQSYQLVYPEKVIKQTIQGNVQRVVARITELQIPKEPSNQRKQRKSFGTSFAEWLGDMSATESCLYLADYDIEKALKYYWEEDYLLVQEAIRVKSSCDSQRSLIALEASMYGFGGKYSDDAGSGNDNETIINLTDPGAKEALAAFGF
jgi:hypothetical protein